MGRFWTTIVRLPVFAFPTMLLFHSSTPAFQPSLDSSRLASDKVRVRPVRVLIASSVPRVRISGSAPILVEFHEAEREKREARNGGFEIRIESDGRLLIGDDLRADGRVGFQSPAGTAVSVSVWSGNEWSEERRYSGRIHAIATGGPSINLINELDIEEYVAGVVAAEIWPTFDDETCKVQAIVARTFVLFQMLQTDTSPWDVTATQHSQVYAGLRDDAQGRRAAHAVAATRGIVVAFHDGRQDRIFCTYYSAACGGRSQSAAIFGPLSDVPPLQGDVSCDYCRIAPGQTYRWGPTRVRKRDVIAALAARQSEWVTAGDLVAIAPTRVTPDGRILYLRISSASGLSQEWLAERFRMAVGGSLMKSTHCILRLEGDEVVIEEGRGFGHGLGLCQWGAFGQVREGRRAAEIIRYYYPGAKLLKAY